MILFKNDWYKYPSACIHYETRNPTFIRLAEIYYKMGVSNNSFHLSLLDPVLKDVNPHDTSLPLEIKARIIREAKENPWYFFREIVKVPVSGSVNSSLFRGDRGNIAAYWLFFNHIITLYVVQRQTGKTVMLSALMFYLLNLGSINTLVNLLTKDSSLKAETLGKIKGLFEELPEYINFSNKKDIFNTEEIKLRQLNNSLRGSLSSPSPKQADKIGRGLTSPNIFIDEAAYISNISIALSAIMMSGNRAREDARLNNKHYGTLLATTAGDIYDRDGNFIYKLWNEATVWDEIFFDCENEDDLIEKILKNSNGNNTVKRPLVTITLSHRQLGYDDEWLKRRLSEIISTPENIAKDIFNQWSTGSSKSPLNKEDLELLRSGIIEKPHTELYAPYNYILRWYKSKEDISQLIQSGSHFIIGVDTSDAVGRDDVALIIRDHVTGEVICASNFNDVNLITMADFFVSLLIAYPNSTMIIERRSSAAAIIDYMIQKLLAHSINPFTRLYNTIVQDKEENPEAYKEIINARPYQDEVFVKYKKHIGFVTSASGVTSRSLLYSSTLMSMMKYTAYFTHDSKTADQISSLVIKNGRVDHPEGGHDDLVIASLLSYWLMISGKNLASYGIPVNKLFRGNTVYLREKYETADSEADIRAIETLENTLNNLMEELKKEKNPYIANQLEIKLIKIARDLKFYNRSISVEEMIESIKREKRISKY